MNGKEVLTKRVKLYGATIILGGSAILGYAASEVHRPLDCDSKAMKTGPAYICTKEDKNHEKIHVFYPDSNERTFEGHLDGISEGTIHFSYSEKDYTILARYNTATGELKIVKDGKMMGGRGVGT